MGDDKTKLRRYEDDLNVGGIGVIILGAWDVLKVVMHGIMNLKDNLTIDVYEGDEKVIVAIVIAVAVALILLLFFLIFRIHLYIGLNASRAAKGEPYKKGYYKGAIIILAISVMSMTGYFQELKDIKNIDKTIASIIVDMTTVYVLWLVISSTRKIRELRSSQAGE